MRKLSIFYFSGTGNTRYLVDMLSDKLDWLYDSYIYDISETANYSRALEQADCILLAYPVYGGMPPIPMRRFIDYYSDLFEGTRVMIAVTQRFFSGDGAGYVASKLEILGAEIIATEHFRMPNSLSDKNFRIRNGNELDGLLAKLEKRADKFVDRIERNRNILRGCSAFSQFIGFFGGRLWWKIGEKRRRRKLKIDENRCSGCTICVKLCPVGNIVFEDGKVKPLGGCVFCYRCVNVCPEKAITLLGKRPPEVQYLGIDNKNS